MNKVVFAGPVRGDCIERDYDFQPDGKPVSLIHDSVCNHLQVLHPRDKLLSPGSLPSLRLKHALYREVKFGI